MTEPGEQKKSSWRDRTLALRHRVLWWLHRYLAFDVAPPRDESETLATMLPVDEVRATPQRRRSAPGTPSAPRPEVTPAIRLVAEGAEAIRTFAAGDCIADVYDVVGILSTGNLSTAYLAHHRQWDIDLILKVPLPELATMPGMLREWAAGVERWAGLGAHPHIASCYCLQWCEGIPLAVTEYTGGNSVRTWMTQGRFDDLRAVLNVAIDACRGLEHAHSRGAIHGSLRPDSILLTSQGSPKVSDLEMALATAAQPSIQQGTLAAQHLQGAPAYVAPERWGAAYIAQPAADVFTLGVCVYEMLFGRPPYASTSGPPQQLPGLQVLRSGEPPPEALLALLRRCCEWTPFRRPASVAAVRNELSALFETLFGAPGGQPSNPSQEAAEWNTKAVSYHHMGNQADADAAWAAALAVDPTCVDAVFNRDVAAWRRGRLTDEAVLEDLGGAVVTPRERWKVGYLLALIHQERGDLESALASLEQAHRERPDIAEVRAALDRSRAACSRAPAPPAIVGQHREFVTAVGLSANAPVAVSTSYDATAALWDLDTAKPLRVFEGHTAPVSCVFLNAAGSLVVTGSDDGELRLWDAASGACKRVFETHAGRISSACLSPDGRLLLWAGIHSSEHVEQMTLQLWDAHAGRQVRTFTGLSSAVKSACFSADGYWVVTGGDDQTVRLWDAESGACLQVFKGHGHYVSAVCISPDGRDIVSGSWDRTVRRWDVESGQLLQTFDGHSALVTSVCLSADAHWALSGSWDSSVRLWEISTGRCLRTFRGHTGLVTGVALSADGRFGISGSWDRTVRRWDTAADRRAPSQLRLSTGHDAGGGGAAALS